MDWWNGTSVMWARAPWSLFDLHVTGLLKSSKLIVELYRIIWFFTHSIWHIFAIGWFCDHTRFVFLFLCLCLPWQRFIRWRILFVLQMVFWRLCRLRTCIWFRAFCDNNFWTFCDFGVFNIVLSWSCFGFWLCRERLDYFGKGEFRLLLIVEFSGFRVC